MNSNLTPKRIHIIIFIMLAVIAFVMQQQLYILEIYLIVVYAVAMYSCVKVMHSFSSLYFYFVIYLFLCNAGQVLLHMFNIKWVGLNIYSLYSDELVRQMVYFQILSIIFLHLGALLVYNTREYVYRETYIYYIGFGRSDSNLNIDYYIYIVLTIIMHIQYAVKVVSRVSMGYGEYFYSENATTSTSLLLTVLFYIFLYVNVWREQGELRRKTIIATIISLSTLMLLVGSRSLVIPMIVGVLFINRTRERNVTEKISLSKKIKIILVAIILIFVLSILGEYRNLSLSDFSTLSFGSILGGGFFKSMIQLIQEMGGSSRCILETISRVDRAGSGNPTILYALLKSFVSTKVLNVFGLPIPSEGLSSWVTRMGGGLMGTASWGYTIIAEAYYDYGQYGFIILFFLGMLWSFIENGIKRGLEKGHEIASMAGVYILSYMVFAARSEMLLFSIPARYCFYVVVLCLIFRKLIKKERRLLYNDY